MEEEALTNFQAALRPSGNRTDTGAFKSINWTTLAAEDEGNNQGEAECWTLLMKRFCLCECGSGRGRGRESESKGSKGEGKLRLLGERKERQEEKGMKATRKEGRVLTKPRRESRKMVLSGKKGKRMDDEREKESRGKGKCKKRREDSKGEL